MPTFVDTGIFYEKYHGHRIPEGIVVRHTCDNRICLNPGHLIPGTVLEYVQDRRERSRTNNHVTQQQVGDIKILRRSGLSQLRVAEVVGCSQMFISKLERGKFLCHK